MNILMILHFVPYPPHGGSLQRSFNLLREISRNNTVHLLALNQKALLSEDEKLIKSIDALKEYCATVKVFKIPSDSSKIKWYSLLLLNLFSLTPFTTWWFRSRKLADEIKMQIRTNRFDLIHFDTIDLAQYARLTSNIPKVLNHHNVESELITRRGKSERNPLIKLYLLLQGWKLRRYERKQIPLFGMNLAVSADDKRMFDSFVSNARIEIVPNGTDVEYFTPKNEFVRKELVFAGGMNWYPNRDSMIYFCDEIYPLIRQKIPEVAMNIIGRSPPQKILNSAKKDESIRVHGYVDDVRDYLARAAVYVVPIRVGGGTRLKILDAFACGKAVVSTSVGCEGIDVTPGEDILTGDTPSAFADQVIRLLDDDTLRRKLEINARKLVEAKYSWRIIGHTLNEAFGGLVQ